ncbi:MAG: prephenate/arogenate dehydrogenase family protein [Candidatus Fonsibacter lacus]|jgi:cyclohexadieny/prephenate dehydrogenase|uniref:prephenate dehydrogenase n=2 Tax=Candidatus Fonsibacter lacus TaxID=2576439 RepID=A0A845SAU4_9PROT|nr:prephenate/arogenate dehydrogenase family protein [Candidatus Fonsibacter lacus]NBQ46578.1 prephenate/arogenate dehydrogenase family protein [Pseudomonadota bacterium]NBP31510.1 prephenate/arogenate dehydrogenase family protein [Candidatus Fonsibacter lacus]NCU52720.1 prephenate/arogenate dehydrogenase family protein [Candidatus Fonsibacter lacus]NCU63114.1 prephenate/arogenate dehydrogenase family protein [Candidatus Fonsibacter lacus]
MFKKITIIGLGLIGSSIARAIKKNNLCKILVAHDKSKLVLKKTSKLKITNHIEPNLKKSVKDSDLVIICTPLGTYKNIVSVIKNNLKKTCILTDVGSAKIFVTNTVSKLINKNTIWIPAHPVAGTEQSGPEAGFADLFKNRWCIITPVNKKNPSYVKKLNNFWKKIGSKVQQMSAEHHDKVMAITSHIPHLIAYNIVGTAANLEKDTKSEVIKYSASGFRDFTRIASSDPTMWRDIALNNRNQILHMLEKFNLDLSNLKRAIVKKDGNKLFKLFSKTRKIRQAIVKAGQDINSPNFGRKN